MRAIDADAVYELHGNYPSFARSSADLTDLRDILDDTPTLDDLRPKGRWEWLGPYRYNNDGMIGTCSVCKERLRLFAHNYCPNCGADMRGGGEDA